MMIMTHPSAKQLWDCEESKWNNQKLTLVPPTWKQRNLLYFLTILICKQTSWRSREHIKSPLTKSCRTDCTKTNQNVFSEMDLFIPLISKISLSPLAWNQNKNLKYHPDDGSFYKLILDRITYSHQSCTMANQDRTWKERWPPDLFQYRILWQPFEGSAEAAPKKAKPWNTWLCIVSISVLASVLKGIMTMFALPRMRDLVL